jgi:hypothetical protein
MNGYATLAAVVVLCPLAFGQTAPDSPAAVTAKARQEAIKSIEFQFTVKETVEPGAWNVYGATAPGGGPCPAERTSRQSKNRLVISGDRIRYENNHPILTLQTNGWSENIELSVSDGTRQKKYHGPVSGANRKNSYGLLASPSRGMIAQDTLQLPMMLAARGYDGELSLVTYSRGLRPTGDALQVRGRKCAAYKQPSQNLTVWVDEGDGHSPRRAQLAAKGVTETQIEVESGVEPTSGLVLPKSWTESHYSTAGKLRKTVAVTVDAVYVNREYAADTFDLEFPPGIDVDDQRTNSQVRVQADQSLVPLDKAGRPVGWIDRNWVWLTCVTAACVVALVGLFSWRRVVRGSRKTV